MEQHCRDTQETYTKQPLDIRLPPRTHSKEPRSPECIWKKFDSQINKRSLTVRSNFDTL